MSCRSGAGRAEVRSDFLGDVGRGFGLGTVQFECRIVICLGPDYLAGTDITQARRDMDSITDVLHAPFHQNLQSQHPSHPRWRYLGALVALNGCRRNNEDRFLLGKSGNQEISESFIELATVEFRTETFEGDDGDIRLSRTMEVPRGPVELPIDKSCQNPYYGYRDD